MERCGHGAGCGTLLVDAGREGREPGRRGLAGGDDAAGEGGPDARGRGSPYREGLARPARRRLRPRRAAAGHPAAAVDRRAGGHSHGRRPRLCRRRWRWRRASTPSRPPLRSVLGSEARAANQDVVLAPMVDLVRTPLAGRNFETLGEDPYLAARIAAAEVQGIQAAGAIATVKHLVANNQEDHREALDARIDDRTLHELYLPPFTAGIRAGSGAVMCGYHAVNGAPACENRPLLDRILRGELGFAGWVMSDWGATHTILPSLDGRPRHGDVERRPTMAASPTSCRLPCPLADRQLGAADTGGHGPRRTVAGDGPSEPDRAAHAALAREVAIGGTVLLRNGADPAARGRRSPSLALIGPAARLPWAAVAARTWRHRSQQPVAGVAGEGGGESDLRGRRRAGWRPRPRGRARTARGFAADDRPRRPGRNRMAVDRQPDGAAIGTLRPGLQAAPVGLDPASPWRAGGTASLRLDGTEVARLGGIFGGDAGLLPTADGLANATAAVDLGAGRSHAIAVKARRVPTGRCGCVLPGSRPSQEQSARCRRGRGRDGANRDRCGLRRGGRGAGPAVA